MYISAKLYLCLFFSLIPTVVKSSDDSSSDYEESNYAFLAYETFAAFQNHLDKIINKDDTRFNDYVNYKNGIRQIYYKSSTESSDDEHGKKSPQNSSPFSTYSKPKSTEIIKTPPIELSSSAESSEERKKNEKVLNKELIKRLKNLPTIEVTPATPPTVQRREHERKPEQTLEKIDLRTAHKGGASRRLPEPTQQHKPKAKSADGNTKKRSFTIITPKKKSQS